MGLISSGTRQALVEVATVLQIQVNQNGAELPEGESISVDVAPDGQSVSVSAVITGGQLIDTSGNPVFIVAAAPTPSEFPV